MLPIPLSIFVLFFTSSRSSDATQTRDHSQHLLPSSHYGTRPDFISRGLLSCLLEGRLASNYYMPTI